MESRYLEDLEFEDGDRRCKRVSEQQSTDIVTGTTTREVSFNGGRQWLRRPVGRPDGVGETGAIAGTKVRRRRLLPQTPTTVYNDHPRRLSLERDKTTKAVERNLFFLSPEELKAVVALRSEELQRREADLVRQFEELQQGTQPRSHELQSQKEELLQEIRQENAEFQQKLRQEEFERGSKILQKIQQQQAFLDDRLQQLQQERANWLELEVERERERARLCEEIRHEVFRSTVDLNELATLSKRGDRLKRSDVSRLMEDEFQNPVRRTERLSSLVQQDMSTVSVPTSDKVWLLKL